MVFPCVPKGKHHPTNQESVNSKGDGHAKTPGAMDFGKNRDNVVFSALFLLVIPKVEWNVENNVDRTELTATEKNTKSEGKVKSTQRLWGLGFCHWGCGLETGESKEKARTSPQLFCLLFKIVKYTHDVGIVLDFVSENLINEKKKKKKSSKKELGVM